MKWVVLCIVTYVLIVASIIIFAAPAQEQNSCHVEGYLDEIVLSLVNC